VRDTLKLAWEVFRTHQGAKEREWAGPRRSGEGQARLGITDVFLRVYYVTHSRFFLSFFPYRRAEMVSQHFYNFFFAKYLQYFNRTFMQKVT